MAALLLLLLAMSTYLLMLAAMTFEVGIITAVCIGRAVGQHWVEQRRGVAAGEGAGGEGSLDCCE